MDVIVSLILEQAKAVELQPEVDLITGLRREIHTLIFHLQTYAAMEETARQQIWFWADSFRETCYEIENVLDELNTALFKLKNPSQPQARPCFPFISNCFSSNISVKNQLRQIALKIKKMNGKEMLPLLIPPGRDYDFKPPTILFYRGDVSKIRGRDEVKKDLINKMLSGSSDFETISVVGMCGVGKTALAKLIYRDHEFVKHFDKSIWVSVSEISDQLRLAQEIISNLDYIPSGMNPAEKMCQCIEGNKVFLVFDGVWTVDFITWNWFQQVFRRFAAAGSRLLVTTRKDRVAAMLDSIHVLHLEQLTQEICWSIISQESLLERVDEKERDKLKEIGWKIAEKCHGLPLVADALGRLLRSKSTREDWENIFNTETWTLNSVKQDVFAPLYLSYKDLPSEVKRCFLYCSIFHKDVEIEIDALIRQWMAQGYLNSCVNQEMEKTGVDYFECLVANSLFQHLKKDGRRRAFKMHGVVHDFAKYLTEYDFAFREGWVATLVSSLWKTSLWKTRHLLVRMTKGTGFPSSFGAAEQLWSLTIQIDDEGGDVSSQDLRKLFIQTKHLRSLVFTGGSISEFPKEVGKLMHLRLLNMCGSKLKILPEAICKLCNLQTLCLGRCYYLKKLPDNMEKLVNLRYLNVTDCDGLTCCPKGIGRLTCLRKLLGIVVRCDCNDSKEFSLGDLENLCHLRSLILKLVGDKIDAKEAGRAKLQNKINLQELELGIWELKDMEPDDIIEVLKPLPQGTDLRFEQMSPKQRKKSKQLSL
ncbi:hypothetical protein SLA2020_297950 [Shorea laevis]